VGSRFGPFGCGGFVPATHTYRTSTTQHLQPAITTVRKRHTFRGSAVYYSQAVAETLDSARLYQ
jgi:hypothetical protein